MSAQFLWNSRRDSEKVSTKVGPVAFEMSSIFSSYSFLCVSFSLCAEVIIPNSGYVKYSDTFKALKTRKVESGH